MKIKKEGEVVFVGGEIKEIRYFEVEDGTLSDLEDYVIKSYRFLPNGRTVPAV